MWQKWVLLPPANEVRGKVICLQVCVCPQEGLPGPRGCLVLGVPGPGGCLVPGLRVPGPGGCLVETPPGRLLLRVVRILLECILVEYINVETIDFCQLLSVLPYSRNFMPSRFIPFLSCILSSSFSVHL